MRLIELYISPSSCTMKFTVFICIISVLGSVCGLQCGRKNSKNPDAEGRIVGGHPAEIGEYPWQVSLQFRYSSGLDAHYCGGTIVHPSWIVTAAHCVDGFDASILTVAAGKNVLSRKEPFERYVSVDRYVKHENFNSTVVTDDIALLHLEKPLRLGRFINVLCLPNDNEKIVEGTMVTVTGWGSVTEDGSLSDVLLEVDLPVISQNECRSEYYPDPIYDSVICAAFDDGGSDACQGDSGGPMIARRNQSDGTYYLAGIVSWGRGCGRPHNAGVYTKVSYFRDWIRCHAEI